jgi:peptide chain release factor subunit 1
MDVNARLAELARRPPSTTPVVSVYLTTRWTDETQRERVRIFLKNHLRAARAAAGPRPVDADLDWIEERGERLVSGAELTEADGVALFAGDGLREVLPVRTTFEDQFVVDGVPFLRPLAGAAPEIAPALVVYVDGVSARLLELGTDGPAEEVALEAAVEGRHRVGGWAQGRYQRHIEEHRDQHFEATAAAVTALVERDGVRHLVLSGEVRAVARLRAHLPTPVAAWVVGVVAGAGHEAMTTIAARATEHLAHVDARQEAEAVDRLLDAAAKGGRAVAGVVSTVAAVNRGAVQHLYLLGRFERAGAVCDGCQALQPDAAPRCAFCGAATQPTELGTALVGRILASGGAVAMIDGHPGLATHDGIGAILRYAA